MLTSLAYDGLVAYRRVSGVAGATLVGALATRRAAAEPRRPHLRLHAAAGDALLRRQAGPPGGLPRLDGALPARASRARHSRRIQRASSARRRACARRPRCDLSRGIESDARARHDHHPPHRARRGVPAQARRCRSPTSCPPARPRARTPGHPPRGTGPYRVRSVGRRRRGGGLVRNPHFRADRPQPAGRASPTGSRSARVAEPTTSRPQIADVERGDGGRRGPGHPFASTVTRGSPTVRWRRAPGQLHSAPAAGHGLDVPQRPAAPVRRHPRARARSTSPPTARASSSSPAVRSSASPTCQIILPAFPGLRARTALHRQRRRRAAVDRARPRARAPAGRGVRDGGGARHRRVPGSRRAVGRYFGLCSWRPRLPRADARAPGRRLLPAHLGARLARADRLLRLGPDYLSASIAIQGHLHVPPVRRQRLARSAIADCNARSTARWPRTARMPQPHGPPLTAGSSTRRRPFR